MACGETGRVASVRIVMDIVIVIVIVRGTGLEKRMDQ
jgi:hypothetical protein